MAITVDESLHNDVLLSVMRDQLIKSNNKLDCDEHRQTAKRLISLIERIMQDDFYTHEWDKELQQVTTDGQRAKVDRKYKMLRADARTKAYQKMGYLMSQLHQAWFIE